MCVKCSNFWLALTPSGARGFLGILSGSIAPFPGGHSLMMGRTLAPEEGISGVSLQLSLASHHGKQSSRRRRRQPFHLTHQKMDWGPREGISYPKVTQ